MGWLSGGQRARNGVGGLSAWGPEGMEQGGWLAAGQRVWSRGLASWGSQGMELGAGSLGVRGCEAGVLVPWGSEGVE